MELLENPSDPRLDPFRGLITRGDRPDPHTFYGESEAVVTRMLASPWLTTTAVLGTPAHVARLQPPPGCVVLAGSRELLRTVLGFDLHRGILACAIRPPALIWGSPTRDALTLAWGPGSIPSLLDRPTWTVLLASGLADPANLGAVIRGARAFAVDLVVVDRTGADPLSRRAVRGAMGQVFGQALAVTGAMETAVQRLQQAGGEVWAATLGPKAHVLGTRSRPARLGLMVGNEGHGLPKSLCDAADRQVTIPIAPAVDSLGVAAATAVLLHTLAGDRLS